MVQCLVSFELVFPPSFFDIMTHLLVLVKEINILGPVFLHNMFPFERFMGVLNKYVHQRARPEESIVEGYGTPRIHGAVVPLGYASVSVDRVVKGFSNVQLEIEGGDGEKTLGEAGKTFICWRKRYIIIPGASPSSLPPPPRHEPNPRCG